MSIDEIALVCPSSLRASAEYHARKHATTTIRVLVADPLPSTDDLLATSAGRSSWLQVIDTIASDFVFVLDENVVPGPHYLQYIHGLMHTDEYRNALLGSHGMLLPASLNSKFDPASHILCLPNTILPSVTQPVDLLQGAWLLRKAWLPFLAMETDLAAPLSYYISQTLHQHANVPSILIPPHSDQEYQLDLNKDQCKEVETAYRENGAWQQLLNRRQHPTCLDYRQTTLMQLDTVLFFADGPEQMIELHPLVCRYTTPVHLVVTGKERGLDGVALDAALYESGCLNADNVIVHDLALPVADELAVASMAAQGVVRLIQVLQPQALVHIRQDKPTFHVMDAMMQAQDTTVTIGLPIGDVRHALWIADLPIDALKHWNDIDVDIVVITDRRPHSLSRLLQSASRAHYLGDAVNLKIHLEQSSDRVTRMLVNGFRWQHGQKTMRHRIRKGGLMPAIVESWYPSSDHNYAVLLEDDIEVSPYYYVWAKYSILQYRYSDASHEARQFMYGISLYSPRHLELLPQGRRPFDPVTAIGDDYDTRVPYLTQVPCSWGAVYFPEHWREFHGYLTSRMEDLRQDQLLNITVPGSRSERWKKSWKKYFIELVYLRSYVMLYPNFQMFESFSTNHLEFGTHVKKGRSHALDEFLVPLMQRDTILSQLPGKQLPTFADLPILNLWGQRVTLDGLEKVASNWHTNVSACERMTGRFDPQDLLCPFVRHRHGKKVKIGGKKNSGEIEYVEPVEYVTVAAGEATAIEGSDNDEQQQQQQEQQEQEQEDELWTENEAYLPVPIDVSQMSSPEADHQSEDDELMDVERDIETLNSLYYHLHPEQLHESSSSSGLAAED
ncbi:hypothetical protein BDB00DRAFT_819412 [Zychaea mexicana]|uniref:uncharacterized protein n=1 Tax=Zychaea mexicana TaxID=64656 RepID=UPI0022FDE374|nr:uncharacterized protein BDB00DRAFT_819412 [Zychaea mexicana]KAI9494247.1 hypothetical protein BDB00DRAFT_819412 [Zychaea mexicana]